MRTATEFGTSYLPGARLLEPGATLAADLPALPRDTPIVVYCSVGYRSPWWRLPLDPQRRAPPR